MKLYKKHLIVFMFIPMFFGLFFNYLYRATKRNYSDFRVYYATAQRFLYKEDIYSRPDENITPFKYSPIFAFIFSPFGFISIKNAAIIFFIINFIAMILLFIISKRLISPDCPLKQSILLYLSAIFVSRFLLQVLHSGQVTILMFTLILFGLYFIHKKKDIFGAALLALSIMFKYTSVVFLGYFIFRKKIKISLLIIAFLILYSILPAIYVGIDKQLYYLKNWIPFISKTSLDIGSLYDYKNQSFFSLVLRYFTEYSPYNLSILNLTFWQAIVITCIAGLVIYFLIIIAKSKLNFYTCIDYSLLLIFMALFNPNSWMTNFIFLTLAYMVLIHYLIKVNFKDLVTITLVITSFILSSFGSESIVGNELENFLEELSTVAFSGLVLLFTLFRLKFKNQLKII